MWRDLGRRIAAYGETSYYLRHGRNQAGLHIGSYIRNDLTPRHPYLQIRPRSRTSSTEPYPTVSLARQPFLSTHPSIPPPSLTFPAFGSFGSSFPLPLSSSVGLCRFLISPRLRTLKLFFPSPRVQKCAMGFPFFGSGGHSVSRLCVMNCCAAFQFFFLRDRMEGGFWVLDFLERGGEGRWLLVG